MAILDVLRVSVRANLHGQETINTFYYQQTQGTAVEGEAQAVNLANAILSAPWWTAYVALHSNEWLCTFFNIIKTSSFAPPLALSPTYIVNVEDIVGSQNSESLPSSMALTIKRKTDVPRSRGRGRIFLTGIPVPWELDSKINPANAAFNTAITNLLANINAPLTNATLVWQPVHYMPSMEANLVTPIRVWEYDVVLRNQRRRQVGVGI